MREIYIDKLSTLFETVKCINANNNYWFRGHANTEYVLVPSAYRRLIVVADQFNRPVEPREMMATDTRGDIIFLPDRIYLDTFFDELIKQKISYDINMNLVEKYCLAQHYGVWTPMIDWTTDFSVACFFACDGKKKDSECDIYMIDPVKWNMLFGINKVLNSDELISASGMFPLALYGAKSDPRMCRQSGNFTVHGTQVGPLTKYDSNKDSDILIRMTLSQSAANDLEEYLRVFGINRESVYVKDDEKDAVSKLLKHINEESFERKIEEYREIWKNTPKEDRGVPFHITPQILSSQFLTTDY